VYGKSLSANSVTTESSSTRNEESSNPTFVKSAKHVLNSMSPNTSVECVFCQSMIGRDIGGFVVGKRGKRIIAICDWCKMCAEDKK